MSNFNFSFGNTQPESNANRPQVDWDALNKHVIDTVGTQKKAKSVVGYISGIIQLGKQPQPDAEVVFNGTEEDERDAIDDKPLTYFKDGKDDKGNDVRLKCWPQKPVESVAITVDFSQYQINKQQFFGEEDSKPLPLRLLMNGEFVFKGQPYSERGLGKVYKLNVNNKRDDKKWSLAPNNKIYQLAVATGVIEDGDAFHPDQIGNLIGKSALFEIRVYLKDDKYFTEEISLAGLIPEGLPIPAVDESTLYGVYFNKENDKDCLRQLRVSIRNQMKRAANYEDSVVAKELSELFTYSAQSNAAQQPTEPVKETTNTKVAANTKTAPKAPVELPEDDEDSSPF